MQKKYKRIIIKLSGEALAEDIGFGINPKTVGEVAKTLKEVHALGIDIGIIVGGGNIWRGKTAAELGMERAGADYMGMLATIMNGLALSDALESLGVDTRVMSSLTLTQVAEPYIRRRAIRHLEKGRIVIFTGGTGSPYFTTDTTAALRASEIGAEVILMAKNGVDGVYDKDPNKNNDAKKFDTLTYREMLEKDLEVIDATAASMCQTNNIDLLVFSMQDLNNIVRVASGETLGTRVTKGE